MRFKSKKVHFVLCCIGILLCCRPSYAVSTQAIQCPVQFVGSVIEVTNPQAPFHSLSKVKVRFEVISSVQGNVADYEEIQVLKYGTHKFVKGEKYDVSLRNGFICSINKNRS